MESWEWLAALEPWQWIAAGLVVMAAVVMAICNIVRVLRRGRHDLG